MKNKLLTLSQFTQVVADTGNIEEIKLYHPKSITTNPSLILKAAQMPQHKTLIYDAVTWAKKQSSNYKKQIIDATDKLIINIGLEILELIPEKISIEIDARLSYDKTASIKKAKRLLKLYNDIGITNTRILIKIAATWQGIKAAEYLEKQGIRCNLTLLFSLPQARACAEAGVYLVSPFVGRILDWYKINNSTNTQEYTSFNDPGVIFVKEVYKYYKQYNYKTIIMGASFRNIDEILELSGCDYLTISPKFLNELMQSSGTVTRKLMYKGNTLVRPNRITESEFLWQHNQNPMAVTKLSEGIRQFAVAQERLERVITMFL